MKPTPEMIKAFQNKYREFWDGDLPVPLYAAPSAPEGWQSIESAPHACHVIACYFYECEWIYDVVLSPPSPPFTHWKMLPAPPALGGDK